MVLMQQDQVVSRPLLLLLLLSLRLPPSSHPVLGKPEIERERERERAEKNLPSVEGNGGKRKKRTNIPGILRVFG